MEEQIQKIMDETEGHIGYLQENFWKLYQLNIDQMLNPEVNKRDAGLIALATTVCVSLCVAKAIANGQELGGLPIPEALEQMKTWYEASHEDIQNNIGNRRN